MGMPPSSEPLPVEAAGEPAPAASGALAEPPGNGHTAAAIASLVLAIVAPVSLLFTAPFASFAMLLAFPYDGPSRNPWLAPLAFWSLPMVFGTISAGLGIYSLRKSKRSGESKGLSLASLCITAVFFVLGLSFTLRFVYMMR
ncbi:hypothetical protein FDW83_09880 [Pseudarthrobacter sp. NamE2]|uniref:hypothetical protein n=1 Tax=Pseudarthrobacter sp. NamE2 TaxID=2576838 RepID=UPI0010FD6097|nr:hypothetical protein [Pseudarthrobacter sp. NamE2]TLM83274.1 hypothetical protein FDW83_09880 [Pseudarthrobacter sp. NamE2]